MSTKKKLTEQTTNKTTSKKKKNKAASPSSSHSKETNVNRQRKHKVPKKMADNRKRMSTSSMKTLVSTSQFLRRLIMFLGILKIFFVFEFIDAEENKVHRKGEEDA